MNKLSFLFVTLIFAVTALAQDSKVFDNLTVKSEILGMERNYAIYLPPGYETSERSYPVLYLLHGATDNHTGWVQFGEIQNIADKAIKDGTATAMIVVMPDADTKQMGYTNTPNGWRFEDFFFEELIPHVENKYRIRKEKRYRAIAGLSMGGGGTFYYALHRPDLFSSACPLSASTGPLTREDVDRQMQRRGMGETTEIQKDEWYKNYSVLELVKTLPEKDLSSVHWFIDCGDDDFLYEGNSLVHIELRKRNIQHEYRVRNGAHNWTYWRDSLPVVLGFISDTFHQH
ncbi:alpha/beta hydrolase family protein [uncultured Draconibacterium sp.]|uniref:alpha/beta hydrolase n=1 Tax=uncultured Draconibacterium sp. TaxID=1573823 RepID=UPI003216AD03